MTITSWRSKTPARSNSTRLPRRRRGLGKVAKGNVLGALLHAMMAVDAARWPCLGLVGGTLGAPGGSKSRTASARWADRELARWLTTSTQGQGRVGCEGAHGHCHQRPRGRPLCPLGAHAVRQVDLLSRVMHDHAVLQGGTLRRAVERVPQLRQGGARSAQAHRPAGARKAHLSHALRNRGAQAAGPKTGVQDLPKSVKLSFVEVIETHPPKVPSPCTGCC